MDRESRGSTAGVGILSPGDGAPLGPHEWAPPGVQYSIRDVFLMGEMFQAFNILQLSFYPQVVG